MTDVRAGTRSGRPSRALIGAAAVLVLPLLIVALLSIATSWSTATTVLVAALVDMCLTGFLLSRRHPIDGLVFGIVSGFLVVLYALRAPSIAYGTGLLAFTSMSFADFEDAVTQAQVMVLLFGIALFAAFLSSKGHRRSPRRDLTPSLDVAVRVCWLVSVPVAGAASLAHGALASSGAMGVAQSAWLAGILYGPSLILRGKQRAGVMATGVHIVAGLTIVNRQGVIIGLLYVALAAAAAKAAGASAAARRQAILRVGAILVCLALPAMLLLTEARRGSQIRAITGRSDSGVGLLAEDQVSLDLLVVAVAREPSFQGPGMFSRILAAPVPRVVWPDKPRSYDEDFRIRNFSGVGGSLPIGLIGTSWVSFGWLGVIAAGAFVGYLVRQAGSRLGSGRLPAQLAGLLLVGFTLDLIRIGGMYRELLTALATGTPLVLAVLLRFGERDQDPTRRVQRTLARSA